MSLFKTGTIKEDFWRFHRCPNRGVSSNSLIHMVSPTDENGGAILDDWSDAIEEAASFLSLGSGGNKAGTLVLHGLYPIRRKITMPVFCKLYGAWPVMMNSAAGSCGLQPTDDWTGVGDDPLAEWPDTGGLYSNFGSGMRDLHFNCRDLCSGVKFFGSQQSSHVKSVMVRGFGENRYGITYDGDTYGLTDVFVDAAGQGATGTKTGAIGFKSDNRIVAMSHRNLTCHTCEIGMQFTEYHQIHIVNYETEETTWPVVQLANGISSTFENFSFRHTDNVIDVRVSTFPDSQNVFFQGRMADNSSGFVQLPDDTRINVTRFPDFNLFDFLNP